jgi:outer membrane receptor for ferrienterochelin and colicins
MLLAALAPIGFLSSSPARAAEAGRPAPVEIRVRNAETDMPVQDAVVLILDASLAERSDKEGLARFPAVVEGSHRLLVSRAGFTASDTISIDVGLTAPRFSVRLAPKAWVIDEVVVTGTRSPHLLKEVPVQTEVIGTREFRRTGARTVDEALAWSVGTNVQHDLSGEGVSLRGMDKDRVLILVDGERAVGRVRGSIDLSQYSLGGVDRIEVVKGTGSTLYGSEAVGGVVNIITRNPEEEAPSAGLYLDYGSHSTASPSVDLGFRKGRIAGLVAAKFHHTDGFDLDESTPHTNGQEAIDRINLNAKLSGSIAEQWRLGWSGRFMAEDRNWIESEIFPPDLLFVYDDEERNRRYESSAHVEFENGERYRMGLRLFGTYYDHRWDKNAAGNGRRIDLSKTDDTFLEASYSSNYVIGQGHQMTYGIDANRQELTSTELAASAEPDRAYAGYFQYEYAPWKEVSFLPGIRYDHHSSFGGHVNPSLNLMVAPGQRWKLRGSIARGFRAPSIKEQFFVFDHTAAGYVVYGGSVPLPPDLSEPEGHASLAAETSVNSSISAEISYGAVGMHRITIFDNDLTNLIDFTLLGITPTYWRGIYVYQNIGKAVTRGIEWESRIKLGGVLDLSLSYDYLYSRDRETDRELLNRPPHTFKAVIAAYDARTGLGGSLWGDYTSRKLWVSLSNTGQQEEEPTYASARTTLNMNGFKRFSNGIEVFLRIENLLDETDIVYGYWPGFQIFGGLKYQIALGRDHDQVLGS